MKRGLVLFVAVLVVMAGFGVLAHEVGKRGLAMRKREGHAGFAGPAEAFGQAHLNEPSFAAHGFDDRRMRVSRRVDAYEKVIRDE